MCILVSDADPVGEFSIIHYIETYLNGRSEEFPFSFLLMLL